MNNIALQIEQFISMSSKSLKSFLSTDKKNIVILAYYPTYRKQFGSLILKLKEKYNVISVVDRILNDEFERSAHHNLLFPWRVIENGQTYYLDADIEGIDLILTADEVGYNDGKIDREFLSKSAKRMYFPHSLLEATGVKDYYDYIVVPSSVAMQTYEKNLKDSKVKLLPCGYPKLDLSIENYSYKSENIISFAPTLRFFDASKYSNLNLISGVESNLIEWLLENTKYKILIHAHPVSFQNKHNFYELIKAKFKDSDRVCFDENLGGDYFNRSDFLITDISTTAFTYSFSTLRPSFFYKHYEFKNEIEKYIDKITPNGISDSFEVLRQGIERIDFKIMQEKIKSFREEVIYNVGSSSEFIVNQIDAILQGEI
ncbi:hypothetical protein B6S12_05785 [Helicobacter valdiviensis]|uniref:CDP-glycerol--glycerophosphate glycerophosphotransferase n=1 Tax=Helicobacter valdiviensis TaxID=1458358 RepID=A0A2W6MXU8_9HELI|nr:CDP-glycerol glycerophosphotransferase family protein [Helicobacter valdiviensis]PZT48058.1 hypothetical protein B6S12_05785 [Helicobacter valdiviensis]